MTDPLAPPLTLDRLNELQRILDEDDDTGEILASTPDMIAEIREYWKLKSALKFLDNEAASVTTFGGFGGRDWLSSCESDEIVAAAISLGWKQ